MKKKMKQIVPRGTSQPCVAECAAAGEAAVALNVRECDEALSVVGSPQPIGTIPAGHRLLLVDGERYLTLNGQQVMCDGNILTTLTGSVVGTHRVGELVVIATTGGIAWLRRTENGYNVINLEDARPQITLAALETTTLSAGMDAITFAQSYSSWPATLVTSDVASLTAQLRRAWSEMQDTVDAGGSFSGMLQVRVGVRLLDDTYMWLGDPVTLGSDTLADSTRVNVQCTLNGTTVVGIPASMLTRHKFRVGITVVGGIDEQWQPLIKAVDILATQCMAPVVVNGTAQYRCIARGGSVSVPQLEFGLPAVGEGAIHDQLAQSGWHVIASTTDIAALSSNEWVSDAVARSGNTSYVVTRAVEQADRLTAQEAQDITSGQEPMVPVSSMTCNGRFYCIDADGVLAVSEPGNALVTARQVAITGTTVRRMMALSRAIYSNGFGRYPIVLFTDEGIYALPLTNSGNTYGEPRLLDRSIIYPGNNPIEANRDIYFVNVQCHLCRLHGSEIETVWRNTGNCEMAWDVEHREVWCRKSDGTVMAVMPSGRVSERTVECEQLYCDVKHGLAVTVTGQVLDLTREQDVDEQTVLWRMHPVVSDAPHEVVWLVMGNGTLSLEVRGERGVSCHGFIVGRLQVRGVLNAPLRQRLLPQPLRTIRLQVSGTCHSGMSLLPAYIMHNE